MNPNKQLIFACVFLVFLVAASGNTLLPAPRTRALLIGISNYRNPDPAKNFLSLRGPAQDVVMVKRLLKRQYNFKESDIRVLTDTQASRRGILAAFEKLVNGTASGDILFIYYSGHGTRIKDRNGDEADGYDEALVAYDFTWGTTDGLVSDDELSRIFKRLSDRWVIVVMDSCHSGTATRTIYRTPFTPRYVPPSEVSGFKPSFSAVNQGFNDRRLPDRHIHLAAAQDAQVAVETFIPDKGEYHGLFTVHFVSGLQGEADSNRDGVVTYREIYNHCKTRVSIDKPDQVPAVSIRSELLLQRPFMEKKNIPSNHTPPTFSNKIRIKTEGVKIPNDRIGFPGAGVQIEMTRDARQWDYLIKKNPDFQLYSKAGYLMYRSPRLADLLKYLEVLVLKSFFKRLENPRQDFNLVVDAGPVGRYYFREKDLIKYSISAEADCYLLWLNIDSKGNIVVLLPNFQEGGDDNFLKKGKRYTIPGDGKGIDFDFEVGPPFGQDLFKLIGFKRPLNLKALFPTCRDEFSYAFQLRDKKCSSWEFYRRLTHLLSKRKDWAATSIEIETRARSLE